MDELVGILFFLLVLAGSALEAYWKSKKKREAQEKLERAAKRPRPAPDRAQRAERPGAPAPERTRAPAAARPGEAKIELPTELLDWLRQGRPPQGPSPEPAPIEGPATTWERGKAAEEDAEAAAEVVSLERVAPRPEREPFIRHVPVEGAPAAAPRAAAAPKPPPSLAPARRPRPALPRLGELSLVQRAFIWAEILGPPVGERDSTATTPPGLRE